ncbi:membrane integrity-associated transporter subunit PqiC [Acetobacter orientalis]|uniref:PqiC family protein n=1 Tax=Acetobacter orientalis TaxID=146474 RepID=UPI00241FB45B|nr:PqiC family protein [Acetobacter orientalis]
MMFSARHLAAALLGACTLLSGCASPPLRLYTLGMPSDQNVQPPHLSARAQTVQIARIMLPDYLDTQDMVIRNREEILRSPKSRWATRLSVGITDLITNEIATFHPTLLITDQPLADAATLRIQVNVSRFDVDTDGQAVLDAYWAIMPQDPQQPLIRERAHLTANGSVASDADMAALMRKLVIMLADKVNASLPPHQ